MDQEFDYLDVNVSAHEAYIQATVDAELAYAAKASSLGPPVTTSLHGQVVLDCTVTINLWLDLSLGMAWHSFAQ